MTTITLTRDIDAPVDKVFETIAEIENYSTAVPHIKKVEFLSDRQSGVGTRFRETREIKGREASNVLEVTEYEPNDRVRIVSDSHGTVWDTLFTTSSSGDGTRLDMVMEARPHGLFARLTTPLMKGMIKKEIAKDLDLVKAYCEGSPKR